MASKLRLHFHSNADTGKPESLQAGSEPEGSCAAANATIGGLTLAHKEPQLANARQQGRVKRDGRSTRGLRCCGRLRPT